MSNIANINETQEAPKGNAAPVVARPAVAAAKAKTDALKAASALDAIRDRKSTTISTAYARQEERNRAAAKAPVDPNAEIDIQAMMSPEARRNAMRVWELTVGEAPLGAPALLEEQKDQALEMLASMFGLAVKATKAVKELDITTTGEQCVGNDLGSVGAALSSPNPSVRQAAARKLLDIMAAMDLGKYDSAATDDIGALAAMLGSPNMTVRQTAARKLLDLQTRRLSTQNDVAIGDNPGALAAALGSSNQSVRQAAARRLLEMCRRELFSKNNDLGRTEQSIRHERKADIAVVSRVVESGVRHDRKADNDIAARFAKACAKARAAATA